MMRKNRISRRDFLRLSAVAGTGAVLAACAPAEPETVEVEVTREVEVPVQQTVEVEVPVEQTVVVEETIVVPAEQEHVTIQWWWLWGGVNGLRGLESMTEAFNAASEYITVECLVPAENINEKYITAIAAGEPPELVVGAWTAFSELVARGALMPLDDWLKASTVVDLDDFFPGLVEASTWMGKIYGLQVAENGPRDALQYNLDLVEGAGLDPANPPQTWDDVFEWHQAMTKFDDAGNLEIVGLDPLDAMGGRQPSADVDIIWAMSFGFKWWNQAELSFNFDQPKFVETLVAIKRFYDSVGVENMEAYRSSYGTWTASPQASFPAGVEGMIITGYWSPPWMQQNGPDVRYDVTWLPTSEDRRGVKVQNVGGHQANIPVGAKHPEAGFKLIEFLSTDAASDINWDMTGFFSPRKSWIEANRDQIIADVPQEEFYLDSMFEADEFWPSPLCPIVGFVGTQWRQAIDSVNYGEKTPEEAARDLQEVVAQEMDRERDGFITN